MPRAEVDSDNRPSALKTFFVPHTPDEVEEKPDCYYYSHKISR